MAKNVQVLRLICFHLKFNAKDDMIKYLLKILIPLNPDDLTTICPAYKLIGTIILNEEKYLRKFLKYGLLTHITRILKCKG